MGMGAFIIQEMFHGSCLVQITKRSEVNRHHQCWGKNEGDFFTSMAKIGRGGGRNKNPVNLDSPFVAMPNQKSAFGC